MERTSRGRGHALGGGVVAGITGGVVLTIVLAIATVASRQDLWPAFKGAAFPFLHERAHQPGFDGAAVLLGLICHLAVSIAWGVLFAAIFFGLSRGPTLLAGLVWGMVVWLVMYFVVGPLVGLPQMAKGPMTMPIIMHLIFGFTIAVAFLPFQRTRPHLTRPAIAR